MAVVRVLIAYDGTSFHGWARQPAVRTVQAAMEDALASLLDGVRPRLSVAGRTDAGVHAWGQVASFPAPADLDPAVVLRSLNAGLAPEVVVRDARRAPSGFDARYSATAREYRYRIDVGPVPDPFTARFVWHRPGPLALARMRVGARDLLGEHDFASFCRPPPPPGGTVRRVERVSVSASGDRVLIAVRANAFCHQMVRSLVGTLVAIGAGRIEPRATADILRARDRRAAGPVAPPHGLTLWRVVYGRNRRAFDAAREPQVD
jgi:tRNA pseudouridine38-40 synthase